MTNALNRRILLVDDMPAIHDDFRKILVTRAQSDLDEVESALFGTATPSPTPDFTLDSAYQGQEALVKVRESLLADRPYAVAFVDMRMPPGWDGVETIEHLWKEDPNLQVVICTAYADYSWDEVLQRLDVRDRLLILKKPFDPIEVCQLSNALTAKWQATRQAAAQLDHLEQLVHERTQQITQANAALQAEMVERKHLEGQLVQSEKLASIGQLAAGVAHEINNPIGFIFSNFGMLGKYQQSLFEMLQAYQDAEPGITEPTLVNALRELRERIELDYLKEDIPVLMKESLDGIVRVRQIVADLKDFSRVDSSSDWQWSNLHQGIDSTLNIVASEIKYAADVVKEYGSLPDIECLPAQLNQVILNLVVNAAHAMGARRGTITIRTGVSNETVWLEVQDTGEGMSPETQKKIFDPFFTTKPVGKGTGLGLSLAYGIVQKHHGRIDVHSEIGKGTSFRVELPMRQTPPDAGVSKVSP